MGVVEMGRQVMTAADKRTLALAERRRLATTLAGLSERQWAAPSLCAGWTVREVAGHVAENTRVGLGGFLFGMAGARFDHDEYNRRAAARWARRPAKELVAALDTSRMMLVFRLSPALLLVDNVVHHQDIRRPLGLGTDIPEQVLTAALTAVLTEGAFAADARRVTGTRLVATDIDWRHGEGPVELRGPAEALLMHVMGRAVDPAELRSSR
ncbi:maleylpyruvate isomerase family mycothiol-dependent enzyme [Amycolatopsis aidingensis]|uniref:maleylpyruvate isomerase family mycothiol-dependent enzyme n=1 Tax=Amycolatopsis aidingensis TaxID=2842453 RepID=UPI001C0E6236|nr:maleylpyruvate isomerase family mycothiol-dependent enzyme [Amycolatopsis aidingensis]